MNRPEILILKDEKSYEKTSDRIIQMRDLVAYGLPSGNFQIAKNRYSGIIGVISQPALAILLGNFAN